MVEVFKTNIDNSLLAKKFEMAIRKNYGNYLVNFDLEDCDNILRIETEQDEICVEAIINLLKQEGFFAEVLSD